MSIAAHIRTVARGPGRARALTCAEAQEAMTAILAGHAAPEAIGALLMVLRLRGETEEEITGFAAAVRAHLRDWSGTGAALDWPSYAAGRTRGLPWYLLSAKLVAAAGFPVFLHGKNGSAAALRAHLTPLGISQVATPEAARAALERDGIVYVPLEDLSVRLEDLLGLRTHLGLRSCVNTLCRVANPAGAPVTVQGVFHPPYRDLQVAACAALGDRAMMVIKGGGGEFERFVGKETACHGFATDGGPFAPAPALMNGVRRLSDLPDDPSDLVDIWHGRQTNAAVEKTIAGTAALALLALDAAETLDAAESLAQHLWRTRRPDLAA
ncbi:glycosyl transferase family protein [Tropicimonas sp. S265A]|uniref:glycosyl transferase family protein n=1 Tax=Tropicimonas sp. S265A TaxID=3415134 RepID=UPI003C7C702E